jgi:ParB family chromosome partitioning protein
MRGDRRAVFVGLEAYEAAGGAVIRNLFHDEEEGFLTDAALLNRLVRDKLQQVASAVLAEGWKWVAVEPEFDYQLSAEMRRLRPIEREGPGRARVGAVCPLAVARMSA